jgi:hypothetical protein
MSSAEDHVVPVHDMVHGQHYYLAVRDKADPAHRDRGQQPQALLERQYLQPGVIGRIPLHRTPHQGRSSNPDSCVLNRWGLFFHDAPPRRALIEVQGQVESGRPSVDRALPPRDGESRNFAHQQ